MIYYNEHTGAEITTESKISGGGWIEKPPQAKSPRKNPQQEVSGQKPDGAVKNE